MVSTCMSLIFSVGTLILTDLHLPQPLDIGFASFTNLSCSKVQIGATSGTFNSSHWILGTAEPSFIACSVDVQWGMLHTNLHGSVTVPSVDVRLRKTPGASCTFKKSVREQCDLSLRVEELRSEPPTSLLELLLKVAKPVTESGAKPYICNVGVPFIEGEIRNSTINPKLPYPAIAPGATPLEETTLFRALVNVVHNLPVVLGIKLSASLHRGTTLHLDVAFSEGIHISSQSVELLMRGLMTAEEMVFEKPGSLPRISFEFDVPHPFSVSLDVSLKDLRYNANEMAYTLPSVDAATLYNLRTLNLDEWDGFVSRTLDPLVTTGFSYLANHLTNTTSEDKEGDNDGRYILFTQKEDFVERRVLRIIHIVFGVAGLIILSVVIALSVRRHRRDPVKDLSGLPLSLRRVIIEDVVLMLLLITPSYLFVISNISLGAKLIIGEEFEMSTFSLLETVVNLYDAGLVPLSVLVLVFSGVYPYIKIVAIFIWTIIFQKPNSGVLLAIAYFGKFSFIDSFAMIIMVSGLEMRGIAEVEILPGFYMFIAATCISLLAGNYATKVWRRNTTLYMHDSDKEPFKSDTSEDHGADKSESMSKCLRLKLFFTSKTMILRAVSGICVTVCVVLPWVLPCIEYRVTGLASVIEPESRRMTLYELSSVSWPCLVTCLVTLAITPILYAVLYPSCALFASWSACDAFLLTCAFGAIQLGKLVEFIIGKNREALYGAETHLLWPLIPLLLSSLWQWMLLVYSLGLKDLLARLWLKYKGGQ